MNTSKIDALAMAAEASAGEIQSEKTAHEQNQDVSFEPSPSNPNPSKRSDGLDVPSVEAPLSRAESPRSLNGEESELAASTANHSTPAAVAPTNNKRKPSFVDKLHAILSDKNCVDIITWLPSGKSFVILDKAGFTKAVLPVYFKEAKFGEHRISNRFSFAHITLSMRSLIPHSNFILVFPLSRLVRRIIRKTHQKMGLSFCLCRRDEVDRLHA